MKLKNELASLKAQFRAVHTTHAAKPTLAQPHLHSPPKPLSQFESAPKVPTALSGPQQQVHSDAPTFKLTPGTGAAMTATSTVVARAEKFAVKNEMHTLDWQDRGVALERMGQVDTNAADGLDAVRCASASLIAGTMLFGPAEMQKGLKRLNGRMTGLASAYDDLASRKHNRGINRAVSELADAQNVLAELQAKGPYNLTYGDVSKMQEALTVVMKMDELMGPPDRTNELKKHSIQDIVKADHGVNTMASLTYRDLLWGGKRPTYMGKPVDMYAVETPAGGHIVLAFDTVKATDNSNAVKSKTIDMVFNPDPESDGTAYAKGHGMTLQQVTYDAAHAADYNDGVGTVKAGGKYGGYDADILLANGFQKLPDRD